MKTKHKKEKKRGRLNTRKRKTRKERGRLKKKRKTRQEKKEEKKIKYSKNNKTSFNVVLKNAFDSPRIHLRNPRELRDYIFLCDLI